MRTKQQLMEGTVEGVQTRMLEVLIDIRDELVYFNENVIAKAELNRSAAVRTRPQV